MTIEELLAATGLTANDLVPIYDAEAAQNVEPTQKVTATQLAAAVKVLADLQGKLTFDSTPTSGSNNPVTSGGIATAISQSTAISEYGDIQITSATSGASLYGSNFYLRFNKVVFMNFGFKLENATVGKAYTISTNIPATCAPPYSTRLSAVATNGDTTGSVNVSYSQATGFIAYADKAGTTYAIGTLIYIIN